MGEGWDRDLMVGEIGVKDDVRTEGRYVCD